LFRVEKDGAPTMIGVYEDDSITGSTGRAGT